MISERTVANMFRNHIGQLDPGVVQSTNKHASADLELSGMKWGLGILLNEGVSSLAMPVGAGGWAGGFNTYYWVDRNRRICGALYAQTVPFFDPPILNLYASFQAAAYRAHETV